MLEMLRIIREEEPPTAEHAAGARREDCRRSRPTAAPEPAKLTKLVRGELDWIVMKAPGEGPQPPLRDGQRLRRRRAALPGRRAGAGLPAVGVVPVPQVRPAEPAGTGHWSSGVALAALVGVAGLAVSHLIARAEGRDQGEGRPSGGASSASGARRTSSGSPWPTANCRSTTWPPPCGHSTSVRKTCAGGSGTTSCGSARSTRWSSRGQDGSERRGVQPRRGTARLRGRGRDHQGLEQPDGQGDPDLPRRARRFGRQRRLPPRRQAHRLRGADKKVKVWDLTTGRAVFDGPCDAIRKFGTAYTVAFSPDGRQLAAGSDGAVRVWDWKDRSTPSHLPRTRTRMRSAWRSVATGGGWRRRARGRA